MTEKERFNILNNEDIPIEVWDYLKTLFDGLNIEIIGDYEGKLFELMDVNRLEGWCWQTTETVALFMSDNTVVYRDNLKFNKYKTYYHGFIVFNYAGKDYVFDPSLNLLNTMNLYFDTFEIDVKGFVSAGEIKEYFYNYYTNPPKRKTYYSNPEEEERINAFIERFFGKKENEEYSVEIHDKEDPFAPMYRNGSSYKRVEFDEDKKVKKLTVHYYMNA